MARLNFKGIEVVFPELSADRSNGIRSELLSEWFQYEIGSLKELSPENPLKDLRLRNCIRSIESIDMDGRYILKVER
ncbi:MAG: hypothetical protein WBV11_01590 [Salegentibacter sp.]